MAMLRGMLKNANFVGWAGGMFQKKGTCVWWTSAINTSNKQLWTAGNILQSGISTPTYNHQHYFIEKRDKFDDVMRMGC